MVKNNIRYHYGTIERGCSLAIPISIKNEDDEPVNLQGYKVLFTIKNQPYDFDRYDKFAFVSKEFTLNTDEGRTGSFNIILSSSDLDFPPGDYFFDIELMNIDTKAITRIVCCDFKLLGGPTNIGITKDTHQHSFARGSLVQTEGININLIAGKPFIIYAPYLTETVINELDARIKKLEADMKSIVNPYQQMTIEEWLKLPDFAKPDITTISDSTGYENYNDGHI